MYVSRPVLEQKITEALGGTRHFILHGESGNGKSWLYKKVFKDLGVTYVVVNLANASRLGSLNAALEDKINRSEKGRLVESSSHGTVSANPGGFGADNTTIKKYTIGSKEPFEWLLANIREIAKNKPACIVFDNFEQILSNQEIVKQISDCIILLDDEDYSKYRVKLCLVVVPSNIKNT
jgi:AAA domain